MSTSRGFQGASAPGAAGSLGAALGAALLLVALLSFLTAVLQPHLPAGLQLPGKELAYDESTREGRGDVSIRAGALRAGGVVIRVTSRFPPTSLPATPEENCPWLPAPGLGRLCHVDCG